MGIDYALKLGGVELNVDRVLISPSSSSIALTIAAGGGTATLTWVAPTTNSNGESFDNSTNDRTIASYRIYYGTNSASLTSVIYGATSPYVFSSLAAGTWYFKVVAVDGDGDESPGATIVSKTI